MSSRFPPSSGFNSRDRSPQRFGDRRPPVGPRGPDDGPAPFRDPPRGPRALVDSPRGGHFGGRGRGYGRGDFRDRDRDRDRDFRDNRDGPPYRRDLDRDWPRRGLERDRDFDPRDNRIGFGRGRSRSPTRDFRDTREPPGRDFDLARMRLNSRDSILSASSGGPDGPPSNIGHIPRGGMRGRGRGDWEGGRGRGGRPFLDDRDLFRRRSRSREPWRGRDRMMDRERGRDLDRDLDRERVLDRDRLMDRDRDRDIMRPRDRERELLDRDLDRRDRFDRRDDWDNNRRPDREERDRPVDLWKRDRPPSRADSRAASGSTTSSHPPAASGPAPTPSDRLPDSHPAEHNRKPSIAVTPSAPETARAVERNDSVSARAEPIRPNPVRPNAARPEAVQPDVLRPDPVRPDAVRSELIKDSGPPVRPSPPPAAPQVPAFGSVAAPVPNQTPTKDLFERTAPTPSQSSEKDRKDVPQRPLVQPPTGPKADRGEPPHSFDPRTRHEGMRESANQQPVPPRIRKASTNLPDVSPPTAPAAMTRLDSVPATREQFGAGRSNSLTSSPTFTRAPPPAPRVPSREPSMSPRMQSSGIPTGPRAPTGPRVVQWQPPKAPSPRGGRKGSKQWVRPGYGRTPSIPNALPKQEPIDDGQGVSPTHEVTRSVPRAPSPFDMDEPESGEILPREPTKEPSPVSPMNLTAPRDFSAMDLSGDGQNDTEKAVDEDPSVMPEFESSSDEEDGENIVFTKEYIDERRQLFEKDMESLRAEMPLSPLEDPTIVALLMKLQLLGTMVNPDVVEASREAEPEQTLEPQDHLVDSLPKSTADSVPEPKADDEVPSVKDEESKDHTSNERVVSFAPALREPEPEPEYEPEPEPGLAAEPEPEPPTETIIPPLFSQDEVSVSDLPFLHSGPPTPISDMEVYHENIATQNRLRDTFTTELSKAQEEIFQKNELLRDEYLSYYKPWRLAIWELDRTKDKKSATPAPVSPPVSTVPTTPAPTAEGRESRRHKGNSELDFLNALKASEISAQEDLERRRTKEATARPDLGREAIIPNMLEPKEEKARIYRDVNNVIECNRALDVFGFLPPPNDFTPEEHTIFTDAFMAHPKRWGKIAESLPGRTFQQCILHYYLTKEEIKYKAKLNKRWSKKSKGTRKGARPKSNALIADLGVVKSDFDGAADDVPAVTDTGRPRRAAAPTFGEATELETTLPISRRGQPVRDNEPVERPPARRGGRGGGTRGGRRIKAPQTDLKSQVLMPQETLPSLAPPPPPPLLGNEIEMTQDHIMQSYEARERDNQERESLQPIPRGRMGRGRAKDGGVYVFESTELDPPPLTKQETGYGTLQPTSYWSVPEQRDFPILLAHFGRDFEGISGWMKTKTTVMVKNFFQRRVDGLNPEFDQIAQATEDKKARGEATGKLPLPSAAPKRRYEATPSSIIPRTLAPHGDTMMEIEESRFPSNGKPHVLSPQPMAMHGRPVSEKERNASRYQPLAQASAGSPVPSTATLIEESTRAIRAQGGSSHRVQGPRLGFFTGEGRDVSMLPNANASAQDLPGSSRHPGSMPAEIARMEPLSGQAYMSASQPSSLYPSGHSRHPSLNQPPGSPSQLSRPDLEMSSVHRDPFAQRSYYPIAGQSIGVSQSPRPGLSPVKDVPRPSATPGPDSASRQVPAKRSNIMSILNDEPEEPQPRKRFASEQAPPAQAATPSLSTRPVYPSSGTSRHDEVAMSGMTQKPSGYGQQSQYQPPSRGYSDYSSYGPPQGGSGTSANTDWMARFDPRAQQTPPQPQAPSLPQQPQQSSRPSAPIAGQGSYQSYAAPPSQASVPTTNLSVPPPAPTPPPPSGAQRSAYSGVFSQPPTQSSRASSSREIPPQAASYRSGSPGPRSSMMYGSRQEQPTPAQSSASLYGGHQRQTGTPSSYSAAPPTPNPVQPHSYHQHVQTMVSGSHQPHSHRSTPVNLSGASSQYGHSTPPPQSQAGRSMASLGGIGRSFTPPPGLHSSMSGSAMGGYAAPPPASGPIPALQQRPVGPGSHGENGSTPSHHRVYSHGSAQGRVPGSLPPPSQQPR